MHACVSEEVVGMSDCFIKQFLGRRRRPYIVFRNRFLYGFMFVYIYNFIYIYMYVYIYRVLGNFRETKFSRISRMT